MYIPLCEVNMNTFLLECRSLSNFWEKDLIVNDRVYESGEHCFHGVKFTKLGELYENQKLIDYGKTFQKPSGYSAALAKQKGKDYVLIRIC